MFFFSKSLFSSFFSHLSRALFLPLSFLLFFLLFNLLNISVAVLFFCFLSSYISSFVSILSFFLSFIPFFSLHFLVSFPYLFNVIPSHTSLKKICSKSANPFPRPYPFAFGCAGKCTNHTYIHFTFNIINKYWSDRTKQWQKWHLYIIENVKLNVIWIQSVSIKHLSAQVTTESRLIWSENVIFSSLVLLNVSTPNSSRFIYWFIIHVG